MRRPLAWPRPWPPAVRAFPALLRAPRAEGVGAFLRGPQPPLSSRPRGTSGSGPDGPSAEGSKEFDRLASKRRKVGPSWEDVQAQARAGVLDACVSLVARCHSSNALVVGCLNGEGFINMQMLRTSVEDSLRDRRTSTIQKRVRSLIQYEDWLTSRGRPLLAFLEQDLYEYARHLADTGAPPTRASAFLEAAVWACHLLGFDAEPFALGSRRVRGAALQSFERKRMLKQRDVLSLPQLLAVERAVGEGPAQQAVFAGFLCLLIYGRLRFGDAMYVEEEPQIRGQYLEVALSRTKTSGRSGRRRLLLRTAAEAVGVGGTEWAKLWLAARQATKLRAAPGLPLMPRPEGQSWGSMPLTNFEATRWFREILGATGPSGNVGMHSCKATLLAMAAREGIPLASRKLLGYHTSSQEETAILYSRDAMSAPLRELSVMLSRVREGQGGPSVPQQTATAERLPAPSSPEPIFGPSDPSDSEESSSESDGSVLELPATPPTGELIFHTLRGTVHELSSTAGRTRCGRSVSDRYAPLPAGGDGLEGGERRCRACFP